MTLSDKRILQAREEGRILIDPYDERSLATSSYDVRLGEFFYREQVPDLEDAIFNIYDQEEVKKVWGECQTAPLAKDVLPPKFFDKPANIRVITENDQVILLNPGETILAHTNEFIGGCVDITTMMKARSSLGRSFILVCKCAGWGDVGYQNRWTMEVTNVSRHYKVPLLVNSRVAQLIFMETGEILGKDYTVTGNYQTTADIEELKANWNSESMLPKIRP